MRAAHIHGINVCLVISVFKWKCTNWGKEALISKFVIKHPMNAITHRHPTEKKKSTCPSCVRLSPMID